MSSLEKPFLIIKNRTLLLFLFQCQAKSIMTDILNSVWKLFFCEFCGNPGSKWPEVPEIEPRPSDPINKKQTKSQILRVVKKAFSGQGNSIKRREFIEKCLRQINQTEKFDSISGLQFILTRQYGNLRKNSELICYEMLLSFG